MVGIRRAFALFILAFYTIQFGTTAWLGPDEFMACFTALAMCYGIAFLGLGAEWFWARWFAMGLGNFGSLMLLVLFKTGIEPIIAFVGISHLLVTVFLAGEGMAARYELSERTAERYNFEQESLALMRRAVKSAGSTLPFLILYGLAPHAQWLQIGVLVAGAFGLFGLLRLQTWGIIGLGTAGALALADAMGLFGPPTVGSFLLLACKGTPIHFALGEFGVSHVLFGHIVGILAGMLILIPLYFSRSMLAFYRTHQK